MTRTDLINKVAKTTHHSIEDTTEIVNEFLEATKDALTNQEEVIIRGFGTFKIQETKERTAFNFKTKEKCVLPARKVVKFQPSKELKDLVE